MQRLASSLPLLRLVSSSQVTDTSHRSRLVHAAALAWLVAFLQSPAGAVAQDSAQLPVLTAQPDRVELALARQKLVFARSSGGEFALTTFVRAGGGWRMLFDAGAPLMEGPSFGLQPARYRVVADRTDAKVVEFSGHHLQPGYDWTLRVEATAQTPLFRFTISCALPEPLPLRSPEPVVSLWMRRANPSFHLDQGPDSIYGDAGISHGDGFPAAYLWDDGREAAIFFNMTPMRWMSPESVWRFHDVRIMTRN